jgi:hypothetical protein
LLGMVLNHYAAPQEARDRAATVLEEMGASASLLKAALERGKGIADTAEHQRLNLDDNRWLTVVT